jgi:dTMP kinase
VSGLFITLEGCEGSGKSTQLARLASGLRAAGAQVHALREPGGTTVGEQVREILLSPAHEGMDAVTEVLLYEAARAEHVARVIRPALASGAIVVCDRYADSSTAYQGYGRGLDLGMVRSLNDWATGGLVPDRTIVLDVPPAEGLALATHDGADRLEREAIAFHVRVREGYLSMAREEPERFVVVPRGDADEVFAAIAAALRSQLAGHGIRLEAS